MRMVVGESRKREKGIVEGKRYTDEGRWKLYCKRGRNEDMAGRGGGR